MIDWGSILMYSADAFFNKETIMIEQQHAENSFLWQSKKQIENAFQLAHESWSSGNTCNPAIRIGSIVLYSYSNPVRETAPKNSLRSHFSPFILFICSKKFSKY